MKLHYKYEKMLLYVFQDAQLLSFDLLNGTLYLLKIEKRVRQMYVISSYHYEHRTFELQFRVSVSRLSRFVFSTSEFLE